MKKAVILSVADPRHMTCSSFYCDYFQKYNIKFDIICTDRYISQVKFNYSGNIYQYKWGDSTRKNKIKKINHFIRFKKYAKKIILDKKYDFVVIWNENTAVLFYDFLIKNFKNRYCINIRDSIDDLGILKKVVQKAIKKAVFTTTPSPLGLKQIQERGYILLNNDKKILNLCKVRESFNLQTPIRVTYMGLIHAAVDTYLRMIEEFGNDKRFELCFFGDGVDLLEPFVKKRGYKNIVLGKEFPPEKTAVYLNQTDIINSYYNNGSSGLKWAIGVKESYGPQLRIPTICDNNTLWSRISEKYGFGYTVKDEKDFPNDLFNWYKNLNFQSFKKGCKEYCTLVDKTNQKIYERLELIFK